MEEDCSLIPNIMGGDTYKVIQNFHLHLKFAFKEKLFKVKGNMTVELHLFWGIWSILAIHVIRFLLL